MSKSLKGFLVLALAGTVANSAMASDGVIEFTGKIVAASCTVGPGPGAGTLNVDLGEVSIAKLDDNSDVKIPINFKLDCKDKSSGVSNVVLSFKNPQVDGANTKLLKTTGTATGVGIGLYDDTNALVDLGNAATSLTKPLSGATPLWTADFGLKAGYVKSLAGGATVVTEGTANGTLPFELTYN